MAEDTLASPLTFITESLPEFKVGVEYHELIQASGGVPPYTLATTDGSWPSGIDMTADGEVRGEPVEDITVFVRVTDSAGASLTQAFAYHVDSE